MGSTHKKLGKMADNNEKKSKVFGKLAKLISLEAKKAAGNLSSPGLKAAIEKARKENMPSDNIERAIKKTDGADLQPVIFETYGPGGVGIIITALTDNNNRTAQEMRHVLDLQGTALAGVGSVAWNFAKNPESEWVANMKTQLSEEDLEKLSLLVDAIEEQEDVQDVYTSAE
jgi:transcriptional/translational regulatory protein YebC/TACO1